MDRQLSLTTKIDRPDSRTNGSIMNWLIFGPLLFTIWSLSDGFSSVEIYGADSVTWGSPEDGSSVPLGRTESSSVLIMQTEGGGDDAIASD